MHPVPSALHAALAVTALLALAPGCAGPEAPTPVATDPATLRSTALGDVVGFTADNGAHVWRGIPFAKPPVGALRWRAPLPPDPWVGTREALEFGSACAQFAGPMGRDGAEAGAPTGSEDCLYLNVFAPPARPGEVPKGGSRLPVMVWIHGGGNTIGDATVYDASTLAVTQDVVVVTVHYRLGVFGWFSHPALRIRGTREDQSGNYGTLDLIRSLEWVGNHIEAFGGDPDRVTVFGESAGGADVFSLLLSPRAEGLFHRAIAESGGPNTVTRAEAENFTDADAPGEDFSSSEVLLRMLLRDERATDRAGAKRTLAMLSNTAIAEYLYGQSTAEVLNVFDGSRLGGMYENPELIRDGVVLREEDPLEALGRPGGYNAVPVILGTNRDENKLFLMFGSEHVTRVFGVPVWLSEETRYDTAAEYQSLMWKASGVDEPAAAMRRVQGASVYAYRFDWDEEPRVLWLDLSKLLGAAHGLEIPFVFGNLDLGRGNRFVFDEDRRPAARKLSNAMTSYWSNFAYTGDPSRGRDGSLPAWTAWSSSEGGKFIVLDTDADGGLRMSSDAVTKDVILARAEQDERLEDPRERCELYRGFVEWTRRMTPEEYATIGDGACQAFPLGGSSEGG